MHLIFVNYFSLLYLSFIVTCNFSMLTVLMELVKHYAYSKENAQLSYYRDSNAKEIDILVEENGEIHPFEVKKSANPDKREVKKFELLDKAAIPRGNGGIICMCEQPYPIDSRNLLIPCNLI